MTADHIMRTYPPQPVTFVRGEGARLWDDAGKEYLDFLAGLAVTSLGHSHPAVAAALAEQSKTLLHVSNLYGTEPQREVAGILERLLAEDLIPVVATIGTSEAGQAYNINADTAAAAIAESLRAEKLVYLTNIEGLRKDKDDPASLISSLTADELEAYITDGTVSEGMIPKAVSCVRALRGGVAGAHILDGRLPHALLLECFTDEGIGTMVTVS